ncbi:MAG: hypothetical protein ACRCXD_18675 [Luteolibacter sp.]
MKTSKLLVYAVAAFVVAATLSARGQSFSATLDGIAPGLTHNGTRDGSFLFDYPAGVMNFTGDYSFSAFCVQPLEDIDFNETLVYEIQNPVSLANSDMIARLVGIYLSSPSNETAAAVQWAIWEVTTETTSNQTLFGGSVNITGDTAEATATATLADQYLTNILNNPANYSPVALTYLTHPSRQDVVTWNAVPEPTSAGLAVISGLLLLRRRRA